MNKQEIEELKEIEEWQAFMDQIKERLGINAGDIYEDSDYHPCLCIEIDYEDNDIWGISLIDGSYPRSCSLTNSGVRKLSIEEAWDIRKSWKWQEQK